ncbi:unnamed protein product [Musa acuminata subsp. malaccensis]|uniref:(wild Malaysian banana) hypothetical protein n=1 Tax=Musa acuminata subsp. malaccensis TaxID=214687 RepID=A0A804JQT1_MUSAM|nr:unnamed protein product [Musa acuminata subsp. malaccensis]
MAQAVRGQDDAEFGQAQLIREATTQNVNPQQSSLVRSFRRNVVIQLGNTSAF